jgi:hypothetical protein
MSPLHAPPPQPLPPPPHCSRERRKSPIKIWDLSFLGTRYTPDAAGARRGLGVRRGARAGRPFYPQRRCILQMPMLVPGSIAEPVPFPFLLPLPAINR